MKYVVTFPPLFSKPTLVSVSQNLAVQCLVCACNHANQFVASEELVLRDGSLQAEGLLSFIKNSKINTKKD